MEFLARVTCPCQFWFLGPHVQGRAGAGFERKGAVQKSNEKPIACLTCS